MTTDRATKILLAAIAIALWAIALNPWLAPTPAAAGPFDDIRGIRTSVAAIEKEIVYLRSIDSALASIKDGLGAVAGGSCRNAKIC
jgi:hypothetical protein